MNSRSQWALAILRGMASWRLAQGFQFIVNPFADQQYKASIRRANSFLSTGSDPAERPAGAVDVLKDVMEPVYLSMSNEIHRLSYIGDSIHVQRYVRRMPPMDAFRYECLVWPKQGDGYTVSEVIFPAKAALEDYGWNRCVHVLGT
jgi:hypothetical protein